MNVLVGSTNVTTYFHLRLAADGTDATGLTITDFDLQFVRSGAAPSAKADATALAATDSDHTDNAAIEVDTTDQPGLYRVDWPDAAFASGVREVILTVKCATVFTEDLRVQLVAYNPADGVRLGLTALPNAAADAAGGLPISDGGGLDLDNRVPSAAAITNLNKEYDGTGYGQLMIRTTIATVTNQKNFTLTAGATDDDAYNGAEIVFEDQSTGVQKSTSAIFDYTGGTRSVELLNAPSFTVVAGDIVTIIVSRSLKADSLNQFVGTTADRFIKSDVQALNGGQQSAADLKDFADDGYNPATNKVQGVVLVDTLTTYTGNTPQTADHTAGIADIPNNAEFNARTLAAAAYALASVCTEGRLAELDAANLPADVDQILADTGTDGVVVAAGSKTGYALSAAGVDAILDEAITEPAGVFTWPATLRSIIGWFGALMRNKRTQTATTETLRNDADDASIATSSKTDDTTTLTRGKWS